MAVEIANFVHAVAILRRELTSDPFTFRYNDGFTPEITAVGTGVVQLHLRVPLGNPDAPDNVFNGMAFANIPNLALGWANCAIDSDLVGIATRSTAGALADVLTLYVLVLRMPTP